jgi:hypothetical protein
MSTLLFAVMPSLALQGLLATVSRPAVAQCAVQRCAPLRALGSDENAGDWVDFDDTNEECVITEAGSTCFSVASDVTDPIRVDGLDSALRTRSLSNQRRSPGLHNDFSASSTSDFKKPYGTSDPTPAPQAQPIQGVPAPNPTRGAPARRPAPVSFDRLSTADFMQPYIEGGGPPSRVPMTSPKRTKAQPSRQAQPVGAGRVNRAPVNRASPTWPPPFSPPGNW